MMFSKIKSNVLYEISDNCEMLQTKLNRSIQITRKPKRGFSYIFEEEIFDSVDAMDSVTDDGGKFISSHQVVLGGFEKAKEELMLV